VLHLEHSCVRCWNLRHFRQQITDTWEVLKFGAERRMGTVNWTVCEKWRCVKRITEERNILHTIKRGHANWIGHILHKTCLIKHVTDEEIEGRIEMPGKWGRRCKPLLDDLKEVGGYWKIKEEGIEHPLSRTHFKRQWICHRADYRMNEWGKFRIYISTSSATSKSTLTIPNNFECIGSWHQQNTLLYTINNDLCW